MMKSTLGLFITVAIFLPIPCYAELHSSVEVSNWKTECVGRYQISVPGEVETALGSYKHFFDESGSSLYRFSDDTIAPFSSGDSVYPHINTKESLEFITAFKHRFDKNGEKRAKKNNTPIDKKIAYWMTFEGHVINRNAAWVEPGFYSLFMYLEGRYFNFGANFEKTNNPVEDTEKSVAAVKANIRTLRPRPLYSFPTQPGVCIPYGFIADDGIANRDIGVTMRLIDHPDVEIFFRDTAGYLSGGTRHEPKEEIEYFWTIMYQKYTKLTEADFWGYRSIKMGGQKGKGMLATIHRHDGSIDYGYIAVVSDNANLPSQMLYVIRTAARAKGKPVGIDDIKNIAEKIMASVKLHPEQ